MLGNDGVFLYPTFIDCANFHLESYYKIFNISYTMIMNALEVPVTNCPMGMNERGLPIGIQVNDFKIPFLLPRFIFGCKRPQNICKMLNSRFSDGEDVSHGPLKHLRLTHYFPPKPTYPHGTTTQKTNIDD